MVITVFTILRVHALALKKSFAAPLVERVLQVGLLSSLLSIFFFSPVRFFSAVVIYVIQFQYFAYLRL